MNQEIWKGTNKLHNSYIIEIQFWIKNEYFISALILNLEGLI